MNREELKALGLTDEQIDKVMASHGKVVNSIKEKADKVDDLEVQIKDFEQQIQDRDKQLKDLSKKAEGNEELQKTIKDLQKANDDVKKDFEAKLAQQKKESKLELALKDAQAKNPKAVKALLDIEKVSLDGDNLIGLEEQLKGLKESDPYLFGEDNTLGGRKPHVTDPNNPAPQKNPFSKEHWNLTEQGKLFREDPELYKALKAQA